jgi:hypothetical protein
MDYRHTEDFARMAEAASLRARHLRGEAVVDFWHAAAAGWRLLARSLRRRLQRRLTVRQA